MLSEIFSLADGRMVVWHAQPPYLTADPDLEAAIMDVIHQLTLMPSVPVTPTGPFLVHPTVENPAAVEVALSILGIEFYRLGSDDDGATY